MNPANVFVVEDDPIVCGDIERTVAKLGFNVVGSADSGEKALHMINALKPDVVLMDISLKGGKDGVTTAAELKPVNDAAIIFLTAFSDQGTLERAKITEPYGYIVKPFSETDLRVNISLALYRRKSARGVPVAAASALKSVDPVDASFNPATSAKAAFLSTLDLFSTLSADDRREFAERCRSLQYTAGEIVSCEGNELTPCLIVMEGRLSLFKSSPNGRELVVEILPPRDLFSLIAAFEEQPSAVTARATMKSKVLHVPKDALFSLLSRHPEFYRLFVRDASRRLRAAYSVMRAMAHDKVEFRIAAMLAELSKRAAMCTGPSDGVKVTRQELADMTGTTTETCIRVTRALEDRGILELSHRGTIVILDPAALKQFAAGA